jgi:hypothetical protein
VITGRRVVFVTIRRTNRDVRAKFDIRSTGISHRKVVGNDGGGSDRLDEAIDQK